MLLASTSRASAAGIILRRSVLHTDSAARRIQSAALHSTRLYSSNAAAQTAPATSFASASRAHAFFTSDEPLIRSLRRRQEAYRLQSATKKTADRLEAVQLAKSEIRWLVDHIRSSQPSSSSLSSSKSKLPLSRPSRRALIHKSLQMSRQNIPLSYILGSIPFGSLPKELTVRPPVLLPRAETEAWATEVVNHLLATLPKKGGKAIRVVDLCTGIALLIAQALKSHLGEKGDWVVVACDRIAVELAKENVEKMEFKEDKVRVVEADVFSDKDMDGLAKLAGGSFDLVVSNPPYIPRREWKGLPREVRECEDPAALIGEYNIPPASSPGKSSSISLPSSNSSPSPTKLPNPPDTEGSPDDARKNYLDRNGLAFHHRLATLLYRPSFCTPFPSTHLIPRLVAEYGKNQQHPVRKLHWDLIAPAKRLPRIVKLEGEKLVIVGVGNALTHPNTRHSVGQVVLETLLKGLVEQDKLTRSRLKLIRDQLEAQRVEAMEGKTIDAGVRQDWAVPVPKDISITLPQQANERTTPTLDLDKIPETRFHLTKVTTGKSGGWACNITLLIPSSPSFLNIPLNATTLTNLYTTTIYSVDLSLYKPSQAMNLSGIALKNFLSSHHPKFPTLGIERDVLVLQDELDLSFGEVKRRDWGSARGHNGVRDIIQRLEIKNSPAPGSNKSKGGKNSAEMGPALSRVRIGIGRPEKPAQTPKRGDNSWLPKSLQPKKGKVVPVDRWVLSPLTQEELESCTEGKVGELVKEVVVGWVRDRCQAIVGDGKDGNGKGNGMGDGEEGVGGIRLRKDQFGIYRTVWVD